MSGIERRLGNDQIPRVCRALVTFKNLATGVTFNRRCGNELPPFLGPPICCRCFALLNLAISSNSETGFLHAVAASADAIAQEATS